MFRRFYPFARLAPKDVRKGDWITIAAEVHELSADGIATAFVNGSVVKVREAEILSAKRSPACRLGLRK